LEVIRTSVSSSRYVRLGGERTTHRRYRACASQQTNRRVSTPPISILPAASHSYKWKWTLKSARGTCLPCGLKIEARRKNNRRRRDAPGHVLPGNKCLLVLLVSSPRRGPSFRVLRSLEPALPLTQVRAASVSLLPPPLARRCWQDGAARRRCKTATWAPPRPVLA
jgi:hypothetical protein